MAGAGVVGKEEAQAARTAEVNREGLTESAECVPILRVIIHGPENGTHAAPDPWINLPDGGEVGATRSCRGGRWRVARRGV